MEWGAEQGYFWENPDADHGVVARHRLYKNVDYLRLKDEALFLLPLHEGVTVLEVGCGNGPNLVMCGMLGATVYGQDMESVDVDMANEKFALLNLDGKAVVGDATSLQFGDASIDAVLSSDFHEHITADTQHQVLLECWRVLKPGGTLVVKTPNLAYLRASLWFKRLRAISRGRDPRGLVIPHTPGTDRPEHIGLVTRSTLAAQLTAARFDHQQWRYAPLRRFGPTQTAAILSTEIPRVRDVFSEDLLVRARKPIAAALFPD